MLNSIDMFLICSNFGGLLICFRFFSSFVFFSGLHGNFSSIPGPLSLTDG